MTAKLPPKIKRLGLGCQWQGVTVTVEDRQITIEDIARAWASIDGNRDDFDTGKDGDHIEDGGGHYAGYMCEAEEIIKRAFTYAMEREGGSRP